MRYLLAFLSGTMLAAALGCGGKVLVDGLPGSGGEGGGGVSSSGSGGECKPMPAMGEAVITVCVEAGPSGGCAQDQIADKVSMLQEACPDDPLCVCWFNFVSAPCPPGPGCCYPALVTPIAVGCQ
jgi:hypothetical protein